VKNIARKYKKQYEDLLQGGAAAASDAASEVADALQKRIDELERDLENAVAERDRIQTLLNEKVNAIGELTN
jgi:hypothetical protein